MRRHSYKILLLMLLALVSGADVFAQEEVFDTLQNTIYVEGPVKLKAGKKHELKIRMKNTMNVQSIGFIMTLPEGVEVAKDDEGDFDWELSKRRTSFNKHTAAVGYVNGNYRVGILGYAKRAFRFNDGEVFSLVLDVPKKMKKGEYEIVFRNIELVSLKNELAKTNQYILPVKVK